MSTPPPLLVQVPREQLKQLLQDAGSHQTVEQFLGQSEIQAAVQIHDIYQKRARAARWSRIWLLASTLISAVSFILSPNLEDFIAMILLGGMTALEFRVHQWFLQTDPRGPLWGFRNQCLFALLFIAYGLYHFLMPASHLEMEGLGLDNLSGTIQSMEKMTYLTIGVAGATGQYLLALFYRRAAATTR
jgi:hypothetical protein